MTLDRTVKIPIAHVVEATGSLDHESVRFHAGYTYATPDGEATDGRVETTAECSVCGGTVPLILQVQRMVYYPCRDMTQNPDTRAALIAALRPRILIWASPLVLAFIYLSTIASIYSAPPGYESSKWSNLVLIPFLGATFYLMYKIPLVWKSELFRKDRKLIVSGTRSLLVDESFATRRNVPRPEWAELVTVIRRVSIEDDLEAHRLLSDEVGEFRFDDGQTETRTSITGANVFHLTKDIKNQFEGEAVELGVLD